MPPDPPDGGGNLHVLLGVSSPGFGLPQAWLRSMYLHVSHAQAAITTARTRPTTMFTVISQSDSGTAAPTHATSTKTATIVFTVVSLP